jgi:hypothetical protein
MQFDQIKIQKLITPYKSFFAEGFNIFGIGRDDLPHLICACPDRDSARAIQSLLTIAKCAQTLQPTTAEIKSNCYLTPRLLADGTLALVAAVIDDAVWKDGNEVEYEGLELQLGKSEYQSFVSQFLIGQDEQATSVRRVYEDTLLISLDPKDKFPF